MSEHSTAARIVIIEDEFIISADLENRLSMLGHRVRGVADTAEKGVVLVERERPDLVIMDIVPPGEMDGIEAARIIRDRWDIPVVFLSAYVDVDRLCQAQLAYPFGYLLKPIQDRELDVTVQMALHVARGDAERRGMEAELRGSETNLKEAQRIAGIGSWERDLVTGRVSWSDQVYRFLGYEVDAVDPSRALLLNHIHQADRARVERTIDRACQMGAAFETEFRVIRQDGSLKHFLAQGETLRDEQNRPARSCGTLLDITRRKQSEALLSVERALNRTIDDTEALEDTLQTALHIAFQAADMEMGGIYTIHEDDGGLTQIVHAGISDHHAAHARYYPPDSDNTRLIMSGRPTYVETQETGLDFDQIRLREGIKCAAFIPIVHKKRVLGCLNLGSRHVEKITDHMRSVMIKIAAHMGLVLFQAKQDQALRESEEKIQDITELLPVAVVETDARLKVTYINRSGFRLLGLCQRELDRGFIATDLLHPDDRERAARRLAKRSRSGGRAPDEFRLLSQNGRYIPVLINAAAVRRAGAVVGYRFSVTDISNLKETEAKLQESEARYRSLFEDNTAAMLLIDFEDGRILDANQAASDYYGWPRRTLTNMRITQINTMSFEELRLEMEKVKNRRQRHFEFVHRLAGGELRSVEVYSGSIVVGGREYLYSTVFDVTERKRAERALRDSEERYRLIWENAAEGIAVLQDGKLVFGNPQTGRELGYTRDEMMGEDFIHFIHPDDRLMVLDRYQRRMRGEKLPKLYEVRMLTKQGQTRWLKAGGVPIKWNGRPANLLFVTDIHEQKQAEAELEQRVAARTAELEVLNQTLRDEIAQRERTERELRSHRRRLRQMASELSLLEEMERRRIAADLHDHIGQCLAFTKWKLKSALSKSDPEAGRVALEETLALIEDMARDVRSLTFEISPPILHELGLPEALEWLIEQYRNQYRLEARFSANSHCPDLGDELKMTLFRGAREILMNVVKHARIQGVRVDARREGDRFIIRVADQGPGFEYQPDRLSTSASDGFGLFSIRERLLSLDGELDVDTSPGRGTVVTLAAPLPTTDDDPHPGQS